MRADSAKTSFRAAAAALLLGCAALPATADAQTRPSDPEICWVNFTGIEEQQTPDGRQLLVWTGEHNYSPQTDLGGSETTEFQIVDHDGFFTILVLARLHHQSGRESRSVRVDDAQWTPVPKAEMALMRAALGIGAVYYPAAIAYGSGLQPPPAGWDETLRQLGDKRHLMEMWSNELTEESATALQTADSILSQDYPRVTGILAMFASNLSTMRSTYRDQAVTGAPRSQTCEPSAPNALIGKIICAGSATRYELISDSCRKGVRFSALPPMSRAD